MMKMVNVTAKHNVSSFEDESLSDASSPEEEKAIPFLRRLRDMLIENKEVISFEGGSKSNNSPVLGRIVVHDRIKVEANVLPRYFNHSSFASLRRQLNYFNFVRLGKGRQRESTYVNENVIELDDILHLKRRPSTCNPNESTVSSTILSSSSTNPPALKATKLSDSIQESQSIERRPKRRRQTIEAKPTTVSPRSSSPVDNNFVSESDEDVCRMSHVVLDLTKPEINPDADILAGCRSLLFLSANGC